MFSRTGLWREGFLFSFLSKKGIFCFLFRAGEAEPWRRGRWCFRSVYLCPYNHSPFQVVLQGPGRARPLDAEEGNFFEKKENGEAKRLDLKRSWNPPPPPNRPIRRAYRSMGHALFRGDFARGAFDSAAGSDALDSAATPDFIVSPCRRGRLFEEQDSPTSGEWVAVRSVFYGAFVAGATPRTSSSRSSTVTRPAGANEKREKVVLRAVTWPAGANEKIFVLRSCPTSGESGSSAL